MRSGFEELDYRETALGELILRRRISPSYPDEPVYEVKIAGEMLMSSTVHASERALATLCLGRSGDRPCDVLVGGLGLGYTAAAALEFSNVRRLVVVEFLAPVIDWHRRRLVPMAGTLVDDPRCALVQGDFFAHVGASAGAADPTGGSAGAGNRSSGEPGEGAHSVPSLWDAILVDIDHSPESWLQDSHRDFYGEAGLTKLRDHLNPGGVFGLWSASEPTTEFLDCVRSLFPEVRNHAVSFANRHLGTTDTNWVVEAVASG